MSWLRSLSAVSVARGVATVLAAAAVGLFVAPAVFGDGSSQPQLRSDVNVTPPERFSADAIRQPNRTRYTTLIATARHSKLRIYKTPRAGTKRMRLIGILNRRTLGTKRHPLVMTVTDSHRRPGWLRVRLPSRPNGAAAWIRRSSVRISATNFRVTIQLKRHRILVKRGRFLVMSKPIGVGRAVSPTPRGTYFLADLVKSTDPFYGPYAFGLSAFSTVLTEFAGGDGQIGIHGTDAPSAIGTDVSHGCIRVDNKVIRKLAKMLPLGTPVRITA
ncbi:hypothetical protein DSM112329_02726 [Paraconexibacter sp. AEG42_29]|uniref:L,D-TPase catalytic domain-containing protein n=1 Tax=Paraconexibacter sp. AEG42_29 TaxID=2997339 RepID=A0AAU7AVX0_9ACTN